KYDFVAVNQSTAQTGDISAVSPSGSPGALLRTDEMTFFVNDGTIDPGVRATYRARNLIKLPTSSRVKNTAGIVAQSEIKYDESSYPVLTYGSVSGWNDPATTARGLATTIKTWLNINNTWLAAHVQYDQFGNVRKHWDAKDTSLSNPTQTEYSSTYSYAYPTMITSADPDGGGPAVALVTTTAYDFTSGVVTSTTDPNNKTTTMEYAATDALGNSNSLQRLTKINRPDGGWTAYGYSDTPGNLFVVTRSALNVSRYTQTTQ